jgi:hypothetical protein
MRRTHARSETGGMISQRFFATLAVGGACAVLSACGGGDKPAYCSSVDDFKDSVSALTDLQVGENAVSDLTAAVKEIETSGKQLVADAKSEFGSEATALNGSITALGATAEQLADPQTRRAAIVAVPAQIQSVKSSFDTLSSAVKSKCD